MNYWLYKDTKIKDISQFPMGTYGFIYITSHIISGKSYIGKKVLYHNVKKKLTKKELAEQTGHGRRATTTTIQKESDWKTYYGSAKPIMELIKLGKQEDFERKILCLAPTKKTLTYLECKYLFKYEVLENPEDWINDKLIEIDDKLARAASGEVRRGRPVNVEALKKFNAGKGEWCIPRKGSR